MATKKISELEAISEAASDDVLAIVDVSETETRKITKGNLLVGAGHTIEMSLNSTTYVLTLTLKNEAGTALSTATIDLPSEDALTNITYSNGMLTLTKQSGATSTVDISGLISGLLSETTFNAFVTEIEEVIGISTDTYRTTSTYNTGDIVIHNGKIYKCNNNNVTGTFDDTKWDEISLYEYQKLQDQKIENKVEKENGKGLSTNDYTTAEKNKLSGIETGAEVNVIESVKVNGTALTPTDKEVDVPVPTKTSDLTNDSGFGTYTKPSGGIPKTDLSSDVQTSLGKADKAVQEEHKTGSQVEYKVLSDNNYTDAEKEKLADLENYDDTDITERVDDIEEEQETQNEDIEKLQDKVANQQKILDQMPKVSGEGTEFTLNNTIEAQFAEFAVEGRSEQETTNGYQLLHDSEGTKTVNNVTFTENTNNGEILINSNGAASANTSYDYFNKTWTTFAAGTYRLSGAPSSASATTHRLICWKEGWTVLGTDIGNGTTITLSEDTKIRVQIVIASGTTVSNAVYRPMLEVGSTTHSWEKYTGGQPAPNVDFSVERYSAGADGSISEKIINKNFESHTLDNIYIGNNNVTNRKELMSISGATCFWFEVQKNKTYTFSREKGDRLLIAGTNVEPVVGVQVFVLYDGGNSTATSHTVINTDYKYLVVYSSRNQSEKASWVQLELGLTATSYVEHQEQTYTMPVQQEMRDIKDSNGNVIAKDEFVEKDGVKYERHNIARVIFNGTETFVLELSNEKIKQFRTPQNFLTNLLITPDPFAQLGNSASNYFIKLSNANALTDKGFTLNGNKQVIFNTEFTTVAELKAWLAEQYANGTPVYVDYIVAEPTDLPCTQAQIDVLENLPETYAEQTNVLSEDTVPANVKASGLLDLSNDSKKYTTVIKDIYIECNESMIQDDFFRLGTIYRNGKLGSNYLYVVTLIDKNGTTYNLLNIFSANYTETPYNEFNINGIKGYFVIDWDILEDGEIVDFSSINVYIDTSKLHRTSYYNSVFETNLYNYVSGSRNNKILQSIKDIYIECSRSMIEDNYFKVIHINKNATSNVVHSVTIQDKNGTNYNLINQYSSSYDERQYNEFSGVNGLSGYIIIDWDLISNGSHEFNTNNYISASKLHLSKDESTILDIVLPQTIPVVVNEEIRVEFYNAIKTNNLKNYLVKTSVNNSQFSNIETAIKVKTTSTGETTQTISVYNENNIVVKSVATKFKSVADSFNNNIKAMFIGDSFTDAGIYLAELKRMLGEHINLYGTRSITKPDSQDTNQTVLHEGRSSWSTSNYVNSASKNGIVNPFYNSSTNTFDFSYYMQNNTNFTDVTDVFILLGPNDDGVGTTTYINNLNTMCNSIKDYNSNIRIHIMCPIPNINDGYAWGIRNYSNKFSFKNSMFDFCKAVIKTFDNTEGYSVIATNLNIDCWYDFPRTQVNVNQRNPEQIEVGNDNVHPNKYGYYRISDMIYADILEYCQ